MQDESQAGKQKTQRLVYIVGLCGILLIALTWYWNLFGGGESVASALDAQLVSALNECDAITEKSAANLVALVEFQKLEILGRKARVFRTCMADHGYIENTAWTKYAAPIAQRQAQKNHISIDESFENLRRAQMVLQTVKPNQPVFWVKPAPVHVAPVSQ